MKYSIGQVVAFNGFGTEAFILGMTVDSYIILLHTGYTSEMPIEQLERITAKWLNDTNNI